MKTLHKVSTPDLDGEISALTIANLLLQIYPSDLEPTFGDIKGFFTQKHKFGYLKSLIKLSLK